MNIPKLINKYPLVSDQIETDELTVILTELQAVLSRNVPGDTVEFGCYAGTTSLFLARLLPYDRRLHVYDSFEGLPEKTGKDESPAGLQFEAGKLHATKSELIRNFKKAQLRMPTIHKNWFNQLSNDDLPDQIAFGFLDGDYYESVLSSLKLIWPKLSPGAVVIVDDYQNEALPGASRAVDEWLTNHTVATFRVQASLAVMVLPAS